MGTLVEWSPNEGMVRKLERLGFALIRTRPPSKESRERKRNPWVEKCRGLAGPFALMILIGIPYVGEASTGSTLIAALLIAGLNACLAVWCYTELESHHGHCSGDLFTCVFSSVGEFPAFLVGWWRIQGFSTGFAAVSRSLSEILDSVTGRHVQIYIEEQFGAFLPLGAKMDVLAFLVAFVPSLMCAFGMEESGFLRFCLFVLTSSTTLAFFGSSFMTGLNGTMASGIPSGDPFVCLPDDSETSQLAKILTSASIASVGFLGLYKICCPDGHSVQYDHQHRGVRHYTLNKKFSLIGCFILTLAFLFYLLESTVLSKAPHTSRVCRDPPLLWSLEGGWRIGIASLGISALALSSFEFLIPLCSTVTKLANNGLLYRLLKKDADDLEESKWTLVTPLFFGMLSGLQSLLLDTKLLLTLVSSSLMCIHIVIGASMLSSRYQVKVNPSTHQRVYQSRQRARARHLNPTNDGSNNPSQAKRILAVGFLKSGLSRIPQDIKKLDMEVSRVDPNSDRTCLVNDSSLAPLEAHDSLELSIGSAVSGYESDSDIMNDTSNGEEELNARTETDVDTAVAECMETLRQAALNGGEPLSPTPASARRVSFATVFLVISCITLASSLEKAPKVDPTNVLLAISSGLLIFLLLVVISRQPLRRSSKPTPQQPFLRESDLLPPPIRGPPKPSPTVSTFSLGPCGPAGAIFFHSFLLIETLSICGLPFAIWFATGLIIYFSYGVFKSIAAPNYISVISPVLPPRRVRDTRNSCQGTSGQLIPASDDPSSLPGQSDSTSFAQCGTIYVRTS